MSMKEHWFRLYEEKLNELEDEDHPDPETAAADWASQTQADQLADWADNERKRRREEMP